MRRRTILPGMALAVAASVPFAHAQGSPEDAHALAARFAATLSAHDIAAFAALFAEDYKNHQSSAASPAPVPGKSMKQASVDFFAARLAGIPDLTVAVEIVVATMDRVAASFVYSGTHRGMLLGIPPTGRTVRFTSCDIFTVGDGKLAEHWGMGDIAGLLAQIKA